jgi:hypothetical protein
MNDRVTHLPGDEPGSISTDREVVEIPLLVPGWQVAALATAAQDRGLTAGEMLRGLLRDFIAGLEQRKAKKTR